jgi:hypothetical protein
MAKRRQTDQGAEGMRDERRAAAWTAGHHPIGAGAQSYRNIPSVGRFSGQQATDQDRVSGAEETHADQESTNRQSGR